MTRFSALRDTLFVVAALMVANPAFAEGGATRSDAGGYQGDRPAITDPIYGPRDPKLASYVDTTRYNDDRISMAAPLDTGATTIRRDEFGTASDTSRFGDAGLARRFIFDR